MSKELIGNQEHLETRKYKYTKDGKKKAILMHILDRDDCPRCWEKLENHYTDRTEVWKRLSY